MNKKSRLLLPLAVSLASLQACSTVDQKSDDAQPAAMVETVTPVALKAPAEAAPVPAAPSKADTAKTAALVDRYTVMPGDTLATIAAKREVYGDARMWQLLYRDNVQQIGPRGLIFPNQVLVVGRKHSPEEIAALGPRQKKAAPPVAPAPKHSVAKLAPAKPPVALAAAKPPAMAPVAAPATSPVAAPVAASVAAPLPAETGKAVQSQAADAKVVAAKPTDAKPAATKPASSSPAVKLTDYLTGARQAFAAGDTPWAIYYYSVYLEHKNTDANAWGELGNVHHYDGDLGEAAKAFYNAANLMIDGGQTVRAVDLIPAIEEGDPGLAEALRQRLTTVKR
jgi:hypothetical protein